MPILGVVHGTKIGPDAPTITGVTDVGLNREYDNGAVNVAFTPPAVNTATSYIVTSSNGQTKTGTSSPIKVENLPTGVNTTFTIVGVNAITIEGPPSSPSSGVVVTTVPYKPTIGVATAGNGKAYVVFSVLNSGGKPVISYLATGSPAGSGTDTASPITVESLNNDVPHAFTIIAVNANGSSVASNPSNVVTPSATGGAGVPAGTFYCYSSDCFTSDGSSFAYLQAPIFTAVSPSDQSSLTNYSGGFGYARGTRVTYCNTVEATAAIGAQQSACQVNYIPPSPPAPCDPTEYTSECGPYTAGPQVPGCSPTSADYGYTITETATKTKTTYDCNGIILTTAVLTCTKSTFTATTNNDPRCPGYREPAVTYVPVTSTGTGAVAQPPSAGTTPVVSAISGSTTGYVSSTTNADGSTNIYDSDANGNPAPGAEIFVLPPINLNFDFSGTDWGSINFGPVIDYDALAALNASYEQPSTTYTTTNNDTTITTPFDTGTSTSGGGGGCFLFGTKITMANGSLKNIEDLKLGDELLTFRIPGLAQSDNSEDWYPTSKWSTDSISNFTKTTTKVSHIRTGPFWRHYVINGQYRVTYEHMIFAKRESIYQFIRVDGLRLGDFFLDANKNEIEITNIEQVYVMSSTVELDVEENDMYFADGILVHNFYDSGYYKF